MRPDPLLIWLLILALYFGIVAAACLLPIGDAMTLEISGHSIGQGAQNLSFAGDLLNVSIMQNDTGQGWNVTLLGAST
jgi:hypothetical protein